MKRLITPILLLLLLAACTSSQPAPKDSGVEGMVTIGPMCPVVQIDRPCPDQPYQAKLIVTNLQGKQIARIQSDVNGFYWIALLPGEYNMHPESPNRMPYATDHSFTVLEGLITKLDIVYDSGVR